MRNRKRILYERNYRKKNIARLRKYRKSYEKKHVKRIRIYREKYKLLWKKKHPIKHARGCKNRLLKRNFGIDLKEYRILLEKQNFQCLICGTTARQNGKELAVDHCHKTDKVRGLLCSQCNVGLGMFRDNKVYLRKAIQYLCN